MPNKDRSFHESLQKAVGEGWLYSEQQQKLCYFKPDTATVHAQWVAIRTYSYVPPRPPEPMTRRRMLRHNAIEAWQRMQKTGWRRCPPPVRLLQLLQLIPSVQLVLLVHQLPLTTAVAASAADSAT